ncbi:MAG: sugar ABC transporter permease [Rhodobacteraceae bacterium]|nr:sugar ABC transporter permease [Paracoccaceae bacterium]MCY4250432.1 sugar ABC transporter permease [Paracoccaceae bacterium]
MNLNWKQNDLVERSKSFTRPRQAPEVVAALILVLPALLLFAFTVVYPVLETFRLSLYDIHGLGKPQWAGLGNFVSLYQDVNFQQALKTTVIWTLSSTTISVGLGFFLALLCSQAPRATYLFRVAFFSTYAIAEAVSAYIWLSILRSGDAGLLNALLSYFGFDHLTNPWLGDTTTAVWGVVAAYSWTQVGLPLMLCFASAQAIPKSLIEAAFIDGAKPFGIMRFIILPLSVAGLRVSIFINLLASLRAFDMIFVLTSGGPIRSTETIGYFMYRESVTQFKLGYGAAATIILLAAVMLVSIPVLLERTRSVR